MRANATVSLPTGVRIDPDSIVRVDDAPVDLKVKILSARIAENGRSIEVQIIIDAVEPEVEFTTNERKHGAGNNHVAVSLSQPSQHHVPFS